MVILTMQKYLMGLEKSGLIYYVKERSMLAWNGWILSSMRRKYIAVLNLLGNCVIFQCSVHVNVTIQ